MKLLTFLLAPLLTFQSAQAGKIIFEQTTVTETSIVLEGGMSVELGKISIVRPYTSLKSGTVRINSTVITSDNRSGVVKGMFVNENKVIVQDSYYGNRTWTLDNIAVTEGCSGSLCVGDKVITSDNRSGVVKGYFNSGKIVVQDSYYGNRTWNADKVAFGFGCTDLLCAGDQVITSDNRSGEVVGFFGDGKVVVQDSYYGNRTWNADKIALTTAVCTNIYIQRVKFCHR